MISMGLMSIPNSFSGGFGGALRPPLILFSCAEALHMFLFHQTEVNNKYRPYVDT